ESQRKFWDAWMDMTRQVNSTAAHQQTPENPWATALDQWWKAVSPMADNTSPLLQDFFDKLIGMGKSYFSMAERVSGMPGGDDKTAGDAVSDWLDQIRSACDAWGASLGVQQDPRMGDIMSMWNMPMDTWQRTVSSFSPMPGDFMKALHPEGADAMAGDMREHLDRFLSMPGVGYSRESQEQYQQLVRMLLDYQKAMQDYAIALSKVGVKSTDRFQEKLNEATSSGEPVTSLRDFYNLWVDACEEVYGEYAMSAEYSEMYGEMVNALMEVKRHGSLLVDEMLESMNMPTHREINTLHQRLHEMRREYRALRDEVEQLRDAHRGATAAAPAKTKAPPVKKRTTKKKAAGQPAARKKSTVKKRTVKKTTARKATKKR
ncbi:MAG: class III poly(R)-hydroxyalkanoic acid synthase subunit PhaE, partial [Thiotrichales bacterium]